MANSPQALKRVRQNQKSRLHNASRMSAMRTFIKKVRKALSAGDKAAASTAFAEAVRQLDRLARGGLIHRNKAARHKRRLNERLRQLAS